MMASAWVPPARAEVPLSFRPRRNISTISFARSMLARIPLRSSPYDPPPAPHRPYPKGEGRCAGRHWSDYSVAVLSFARTSGDYVRNLPVHMRPGGAVVERAMAPPNNTGLLGFQVG